MERTTWTDQRLDDLARRMDAGFERVDADIRELRAEVHQGFAAIQSTMNRFGAGMIISLIGVIATLILRGG